MVLRVKLRDSSVTTGAGLTGLTSASTGLVISTIADNEASATAYTVAGSTIETITTLGTYAAPTATKCRFKEVDATNHPGLYELQIADARFAVASAKSLTISLSGATNLAQCDVVVPLRTVNPYAADGGLTLAKTTNITGFNDIAATDVVSSGAITTSGGAVSTVSTVTNAVTLPTIPANWISATGIASGAITNAKFASVDANGYLNVNAADINGATATVTTFPTNFSSLSIDVSGRVTANLTQVNGNTFSGANVPTDLQTIKTQTVTCAAGVTISPYVGNASAALQVDTSGYVKVSEGLGQGQIVLNLGYVTASTVIGAVQGDVYGDVRGKMLGTATAGTIVGAGAWSLNGSGGAIPTAAQNAAVILATPANLLATDAAGRVTLQPTQTGVTIPTVTTVTSAVTAGTVSDKTGYSLASTGLDAIAVTAPTTVATTFPQMVVQTWRRFFKKAVLTGGLLKTYADDGTTVVTTQTSTDVTTSETQGAST